MRTIILSSLLAPAMLLATSMPLHADAHEGHKSDAISDAIKYRQAGYRFMSWNMGRIKAQVVDETEPFDPATVAAAANAIAALANSGMGALYLPGSDQGVGYTETRAKPEIWTDQAGVGKVAREFNQAANKLAEVAATGDAAAIKTAFGATGKACKACHDDYREEND